ncbi:MAG: methyltransferase domain-containing protein [Dehalococcoidaceae bacterium]|nr:methyltransferase domain-containing protein [Dehalococcoidaceae bacterium]
MHRSVLDRLNLYCTACCCFEGGISQHRLVLEPGLTEGDFILSGWLACPNCGKKYPIEDGVPCLVESYPDNPEVTSQYLDAHYSTLNGGYWQKLAACISPGLCLDAGCSVGRFTFECAGKGFALGIDTNLAQLKLAARFQRQGYVKYHRRTRSLGYEEVTSAFEPSPGVLFILADVLNPPLRMETFDFISGLNFIDSVRTPLTALGQMDAMLKPGGRLLLSSPYVWDETITRDWLETENTKPHRFLTDLLEGRIPALVPFNYTLIKESEGLAWRLRRQNSSHFVYYADTILAEKKA